MKGSRGKGSLRRHLSLVHREEKDTIHKAIVRRVYSNLHKWLAEGHRQKYRHGEHTTAEGKGGHTATP